MSSSEELFCDVGRGVTLCYETIGDPSDPPLMLVMGLGLQMIAWDDDFCGMLAERGFNVVRFDNRDTGRSTDMGRPPPPGLMKLATRRFDSHQYDLSDMAEDAAGLLRETELGPAHVVGASLGAMVAQTMAAQHPGSVRTLTSMMSTTGSRVKGQPALGTYRYLLKAAPREREAFVDHIEQLFRFIGSPGFDHDIESLRARSELSWERGTNPAGTGRQLAAVLKSGDRTKELRRVTAPTLVIHGSEDKLIRPSGGMATVTAIPDAELITIEGMGHDLPRQVWPRLVDAIAERAKRFDAALQPA